MRKYYCGVLRCCVSQNSVVITGTLRLDRFTYVLYVLYVFS